MRLFALPLIALAGLAGCGVPQAGGSTPPPAKPACPAGEVVVHNDDATTCDLVAGVNTLTIVVDSTGSDADLARAQRELEDAGCSDITWVNGAQGTGRNCDF